MSQWPEGHRQCPFCACVAQWHNGGIWLGTALGRSLKSCIYCQGVYASAFYAFTKTQSTICWAEEGTKEERYITNVHGRVFSIVDGYWGALVGACAEQEMWMHSPLDYILSFMSGESWDRVSGLIQTTVEKWMLRTDVRNLRNIAFRVTPHTGLAASSSAPAGQGAETLVPSTLATP